MKDFFRRLIAVDNTVNEQTFIGLFWALVALGTGITAIFIEPAFAVFVSSLSASLLCFGLNWKHK